MEADLTHSEPMRYQTTSAHGRPSDGAPNAVNSRGIPTGLTKHRDSTISPDQMNPNLKTSAVRGLRTEEGMGIVAGS